LFQCQSIIKQVICSYVSDERFNHILFFATSDEIMGSWVDNSLMEEDVKKFRKCMQFFSGGSGPSLVTT